MFLDRTISNPLYVLHREHHCTTLVTVDVLRRWCIYWRKGQTQPLKMKMVKSPSHQPSIQDTSMIIDTVSYLVLKYKISASYTSQQR